jgi:hypothetical protein
MFLCRLFFRDNEVIEIATKVGSQGRRLLCLLEHLMCQVVAMQFLTNKWVAINHLLSL